MAEFSGLSYVLDVLRVAEAVAAAKGLHRDARRLQLRGQPFAHRVLTTLRIPKMYVRRGQDQLLRAICADVSALPRPG